MYKIFTKSNLPFAVTAPELVNIRAGYNTFQETANPLFISNKPEPQTKHPP